MKNMLYIAISPSLTWVAGVHARDLAGHRPLDELNGPFAVVWFSDSEDNLFRVKRKQ